MSAVTTCPVERVVGALRNKRWRIGKPPKEPSDWQPTRVTSPEGPMHLPFTDRMVVAWLAEQLENGLPLTEIVLKRPPGQVAWYWVGAVPSNAGDIYVKFSYVNDCVVLRSFHPSDK